MKLPRLLLCLFAAIALAMPPLAVRGAAPATGPVEMDCPHHAPSHDQGDSHRDTSKQAAQSCCPSAPFGWAVIAAGQQAHYTFPEPVTLYVTYRTVGIGRDGAPVFRDDIYGRDRRVVRDMGKPRS